MFTLLPWCSCVCVVVLSVCHLRECKLKSEGVVVVVVVVWGGTW